MDEKQKLLKRAPKQVQQAYATMVANAEKWLRSELPGDSAGVPCVNTEAHAHCDLYHSDELGWMLQDLKQACYGGGGICLHPKDGWCNLGFENEHTPMKGGFSEAKANCEIWFTG